MRVYLRDASRIQALEVTIQAPGKQLRYRLSGDAGAFHLSGDDDSITLRASDLEAAGSVPLAPAKTSVLQVAWGPGQNWRDVASWYEGLIQDVPRDGERIAETTKKLLAGAKDRRAAIDAIVRYVQREIRYEAVEVGAGGYVPSAPAKVLDRGWGDCKDKSFLLRELLRRAGVPSHLVLLHAGSDVRLDPTFPTPELFNHCILGIPSGSVPIRTGDPVADGVLLVDPTQLRGGSKWLSRYCRGDAALLIAGDESRLLSVEDDPEAERREVEIRGRVNSEGDLSAKIVVRLFGDAATAWLDLMARASRDARDQTLRKVADHYLPGCVTGTVACRTIDNQVPAVELLLHATAAAVLRGPSDRRWIPIRALDTFPEPRILDNRKDPILLHARIDTTRWVLSLPPGSCPPVAVDRRQDLPIGSVSMQVETGPRGVR